MTRTDELDRTSVQALQEDADCVLELIEDVRGSRKLVERTIAGMLHNYFESVRRSRPLIMSHGEKATLQVELDPLKGRFRLFCEAI
jgi:hypothetical protein